MKVTCSHCGAQFSIDDAKVPPQGARLRCAKCHEFFVCPPPPAAKTPVPKRTLVPDAPPSAAAVPPPVPMPPADAAKPAAAVGANAVPLPDSQTAGLSEDALFGGGDGPAADEALPLPEPEKSAPAPDAVALPDAPPPVPSSLSADDLFGGPDGNNESVPLSDGSDASAVALPDAPSPVPSSLSADDLFGGPGGNNESVPLSDGSDASAVALPDAPPPVPSSLSADDLFGGPGGNNESIPLSDGADGEAVALADVIQPRTRFFDEEDAFPLPGPERAESDLESVALPDALSPEPPALSADDLFGAGVTDLSEDDFASAAATPLPDAKMFSGLSEPVALPEVKMGKASARGDALPLPDPNVPANAGGRVALPDDSLPLPSGAGTSAVALPDAAAPSGQSEDAGDDVAEAFLKSLGGMVSETRAEAEESGGLSEQSDAGIVPSLDEFMPSADVPPAADAAQDTPSDAPAAADDPYQSLFAEAQANLSGESDGEIEGSDAGLGMAGLDEPVVPASELAADGSLDADAAAPSLDAEAAGMDAAPFDGGAPESSGEGDGDSAGLDMASLFGASDDGKANAAGGTSPASEGGAGEDANDLSNLLTFNDGAGDAGASAASSNEDYGTLDLDLGNAGSGDAGKAAPADGAHTGKDGVEVLDFIEEGAKGAAAGKIVGDGVAYRIRRGKEKERGPFDMVTVIYMISSGQLFGDEEVSADGASWTPLNAIPAFAAAIQQLMESPGDVSFAVDNMGAKAVAPKDEALERAKARYGDRIADIAVIHTEDPKKKFLRPPVIAAGAALLLLLGGGASLGLTSYGMFGMNLLFPKEIQSGSPEYSQVVQAREALAEGTWDGSRRALKIAEKLVSKDMSLVEPRALYAQAVYRLKRINQADTAQKNQADRYLRDLAGGKDRSRLENPDTLKAQVASDLLQKNAAHRSALEKYVQKTPADMDARFLLAELLEAVGDKAGARSAFEKLSGEADAKVSARAFDEMARMALAEEFPEAEWREVTAVEPIEESAAEGASDKTAKADGAKRIKVSPAVFNALELLDKAIAADPEHVESILNKAGLLTERLLDRPKALETLALLDGEEKRDLLCRPDRAQADYLRALNLAALRRYDEAFAAFDKAMEQAPERAEIPAFYGRIKLNQGDYEKAAKLLEQATGAAPENIEYMDGYIRALIALEKFHPAQSLAAKALEERPDDSHLAFLKGLILDAMGESETDAVANFKKAWDDEKVGWEAALHLGNIFLRQKKLDEAKAAFEKSLAAGGERSQPHVGLGRYYLGTDKAKEALDAFDTAIRLDGENASAHFGRAEALFALGRLKDAEAAFERAAAINDKLPRLMARYGELLWRLEKREEAVEAFGKAKALDYRDFQSVWRKGAVEFEIGKNYAAALEDLSAALASSPGLTEALYYKARVHFERKETTLALQAIKGALERDQDSALFHFWAGNIYEQGQKYMEAINEWMKTIRLDSKHADAMQKLAGVFRDQGNFANAATYYAKTLEAAPDRKMLNYEIAECMFSMNNYNGAIEKYLEVIKAFPDHKMAHFRIGRAYNELRKLDQAVTWYEKTLALDENFAEAWMYLGYANKEKFKYQKAIQAFEHYLKTATNKRDIEMVKTEIFDLKSLQ